MKVAIRTDASLIIGSGHVMRCKTLADELRRRGAEVVFICREHPGNLIHSLEEDGYSTHVLPMVGEIRVSLDQQPDDYSLYLGVEQSEDRRQTIEALRDFNPDWLVVDHYSLETAWEKRLRQYVKRIFVIDDLANRHHDCNVLLDQNLYEDMNTLYDGLVPEHAKKLIGPRFALLRPEFRKARETLRQRDGTVRRILVFFGGVDPTGETEKALDAIEQLNRPEIAVDVVVGGSNPRIDAIQERCSSMPNATFHRQVSNMAELMASADLGLGAGGTATWERCCLGLPTLVTIIADNQAGPTSNLAGMGAVVNLGTSAQVDPQDYVSAIINLTPDSLKGMQIKCLNLVDGRGLERVILSMSIEPVRLRLATEKDAEKVWLWRNHPDTRRYSTNPSPIPFETHLSWWRQSLSNPRRVILIGSYDELEFGVLRYDLFGEHEAQIAVYLDPDLHSLGLGTSLLTVGQKWISENLPNVIDVQATIDDKNVVSKRAFASAGFNPNSISTLWVKDVGPCHNTESIELMKT